MPSIIFPLEIEEMILNILGEDDEGHSALTMCSLVCHAFLPICRKHIFRSIALNDYSVPSHNTQAFERLLRETPEIAEYIRKLDYTIHHADFTSTSIHESLKRISRLEFLTLGEPDIARFNWRRTSIRPALLHLLHLPTLTHFQVTDNTYDFIVSDLIPCVNLKYLNIGNNMTVAAKNIYPAASSFPVHSIQLNEFVAGLGTSSSSAIMKLSTTCRPDGQPIIDFGSLSKITVVIEEPNDSEASQELFKLCHALTNVNITCKWYLHRDHQDF
jgi:hypothetical protein